jgi:hypothetical protein
LKLAHVRASGAETDACIVSQIYRDDENDRRITSITYKLSGTGIWNAYSDEVHYYWDDKRSLQDSEIAEVAVVILRTAITERI